LTKAYAKRTVGDEEPVLSSGEIGRILGPCKEMIRREGWTMDAAIEEGWMKSDTLAASASATT